jgi:hypothetical protein
LDVLVGLFAAAWIATHRTWPREPVGAISVTVPPPTLMIGMGSVSLSKLGREVSFASVLPMINDAFNILNGDLSLTVLIGRSS